MEVVGSVIVKIDVTVLGGIYDLDEVLSSFVKSSEYLVLSVKSKTNKCAMSGRISSDISIRARVWK